MIDISILFHFGSAVSVIKDVVLAVAGILTACAALRGLHAWKEQKADERFHSATNKAWQEWYQLIDAIQSLNVVYQTFINVYSEILIADEPAHTKHQEELRTQVRLAYKTFNTKYNKWRQTIWEITIVLPGIREELEPIGKELQGKVIWWLSEAHGVLLRIDKQANKHYNTILQLGSLLELHKENVLATGALWGVKTEVDLKEQTYEEFAESLSTRVLEALQNHRPN